MSASTSARSRARAELTREIKDVAREQLAAEGADRLSLRAVARELQMAPSALYRYFPSRDDLLTALIVEAYEAVADTAEAADRGPDLTTRWRRVWRAIRTWALAHPQEFALLYGSPVPGYHAPADTIAPAVRAYRVLLRLTAEVDPPASGHRLPAALKRDAAAIRVTLELPETAPDVVIRTIAAWTQLIGAISQELFGHLRGAFTDDGVFFDHSVDLMAHLVGIGQR